MILIHHNNTFKLQAFLLRFYSIKCRPHFLPREFTLAIITAVYIPPQASTEAVLLDLCKELNCSQKGNPDAVLNVLVPNFHQHIDCSTRGINTLDHCYTAFKNSYRAESLHSVQKEWPYGHLAMVQVRKQTMSRPKWSGQSVAALQRARHCL